VLVSAWLLGQHTLSFSGHLPSPGQFLILLLPLSLSLTSPPPPPLIPIYFIFPFSFPCLLFCPSFNLCFCDFHYYSPVSPYKGYFFPSFAYQAFILISSLSKFFICSIYIFYFVSLYWFVLSYLHSTYCISCLFPCVSLSFLPMAWLRSPPPFSHWSGQGSAFSNLLLYPTQLFCVWLTHHPDNGGSKLLWNISQCLPDYMTQHPWRQSSSPRFNVSLHTHTCSHMKTHK
jgi:hypothetical protein